MFSRSEAGAPAAGVTFDQLLETVRYDGAYATRRQAEQAVHTVLAALGRQLSAEDRASLAARLPAEAARTLTGQASDPEQLSGRQFVEDLAGRTGGTHATARWDAGVVLTAVAALAGRQSITHVLARLPSGYALLFGHAELLQAA
jgi:uncharacterized protein (DUF2267 family)